MLITGKIQKRFMQLPDCELMSTGSAEQETELTTCFKLSMCSSYLLKSRPYFVITGQQGTPYLQTRSSKSRKLAPSLAGGSRREDQGTGSRIQPEDAEYKSSAGSSAVQRV